MLQDHGDLLAAAIRIHTAEGRPGHEPPKKLEGELEESRTGKLACCVDMCRGTGMAHVSGNMVKHASLFGFNCHGGTHNLGILVLQ